MTVKLCATPGCGRGITTRAKFCPECVEAHQREYATEYRHKRAWSPKTHRTRIEVLQPGMAWPDHVTPSWLETWYYDLPAGTLVDGQPIEYPAQAGESEK
jgi:hypothetical protein